MEKSLFEQMGGSYKQVGDYLLPDVELPEEKPIGVWGQRHYKYLRNAKRILFSQLTISGKMNEYPTAFKCSTVYGISQGEKYTDDIRQACSFLSEQ